MAQLKAEVKTEPAGKLLLEPSVKLQETSDCGTVARAAAVAPRARPVADELQPTCEVRSAKRRAVAAGDALDAELGGVGEAAVVEDVVGFAAPALPGALPMASLVVSKPSAEGVLGKAARWSASPSAARVVLATAYSGAPKSSDSESSDSPPGCQTSRPVCVRVGVQHAR
jgi:hypothetical protein